MAFTNGKLVVKAKDAGPVPVMMDSLLSMARSGAYDQALVSQKNFYTTNYTLPLLFLEDGNYLSTVATQQHLTGSQWGMMNETATTPVKRGCGSTPSGTRFRHSVRAATPTYWYGES